MNLTIAELETKTWSEVISLYSDLTEFKTTSKVRGLIIRAVPPVNLSDNLDGNVNSVILIVLRNCTDDSIVTIKSLTSFLNNGFKNYLSFLHSSPNFSDFKISEGSNFKNYDSKNIIDYDTLCKKLQQNKNWKNLSHVVKITNINPFNLLYRISHANALCSEERDTISLSSKSNCSYNAYYIAYDKEKDECGFYCQDGSFICTIKEYVSKFTIECFIHLGPFDMYLSSNGFSVQPSVPERRKPNNTFTIAYNKEGYITLFNILDNFNKIKELTDNFISICRTSTALVK